MTSTPGQRKAALYLAALHPADRHALLGALPPAKAAPVLLLVAQLQRRGWDDPAIAHRALAEEMHGVAAPATLDIEAQLQLASRLPAGWVARVIAANTSADPAFMLALIDGDASERVGAELRRVPRLPPALAKAVVAEAQAFVAGGAR